MAGSVSFGSQRAASHRLQARLARTDWPVEGGSFTCSRVQRPMTLSDWGVGHMQLANHFPAHDVRMPPVHITGAHADYGQAS